jgi:protein O-mannosyl-transferase
VRPRQTCIALIGLTLITFWPLLHHEFVNYDDPIYVTENPRVASGLSWQNVGWALRTGHAANWHPVTWLSHMLDVQLFGLNPGWHHFTSLLFHAANTVLLFGLLHRMTQAAGRSAVVAALFAVHPLHVESVAWVAERKDVLSGFFFMLTLWAYVRYVEQSTLHAPGSDVTTCAPGAERQSTENHPTAAPFPVSRFTFYVLRYYLLALLFFALGLMSKPMLVTLPFVLLLLDYWPLDRCELKTQNSKLKTILLLLVREKIPFFVLSAATSVVTMLVQSQGGAVRSMGAFPFSQRLGNAAVACFCYLGQTFWPVNLAVFYPMPDRVPLGLFALAVGVLGCVTAASLFRFPVFGFRTSKAASMGWFWFLIMLIPVIGLVQVGMQQRADRYMYLPSIGLFVLLVWGCAEWWPGKLTKVGLAAGAIAGCALAAHVQVGHWQNSERLFRHALEVTRGNYIAHNNLGYALFTQGKVDDAIAHYESALQLNPNYEDAHSNLGRALAAQGKYAAAGVHFEAVLKLRPDDFKAHNNLGNVLAEQGRHPEAVLQFQEALRLKPNHAGAHNNLAISYQELGRTAEAIAQYRAALRWQPDSLEAINNLAWILATSPGPEYRDGAEAVTLSTRACERTRYRDPRLLATLSAACAETGQFTDAVAFAQRAQQLAGKSQPALSSQLESMLHSFGARRPYRSK